MRTPPLSTNPSSMGRTEGWVTGACVAHPAKSTARPSTIAFHERGVMRSEASPARALQASRNRPGKSCPDGPSRRRTLRGAESRWACIGGLERGALAPIGERVVDGPRQVLAADGELHPEGVAVGQKRPDDLSRALVTPEDLDQAFSHQTLAELALLAELRPVVRLAAIVRAHIAGLARARDGDPPLVEGQGVSRADLAVPEKTVVSDSPGDEEH